MHRSRKAGPFEWCEGAGRVPITTPLEGDGLELHFAAAGRNICLIITVQVEQLGRVVIPVADYVVGTIQVSSMFSVEHKFRLRGNKRNHLPSQPPKP